MKVELLDFCRDKVAKAYPALENKSGEPLKPDKLIVLSDNDRAVLSKRI